MDSINEYQSRINEIVNDYLRRNLSSSNTMDMLKKCEPVIVSMKESYGKTNSQYIEVSTNLAGVVLRMIVKIINDAQKSYNPYPSFYSSGSSSLTTEVGNALVVLTELIKLDLDKSFIKDRLDPNLKTLSSMASQIGAMPTCFTIIDIRTEDEYFNECETADDFRQYCQKYPRGKYKEQAISKAERIEKRQKNWKKAKLIIILSLVGIVAGIIGYLIATADDRKFDSVPKTKSGYETYLREYPNGKHKDESLDALYKIAESKDLTELLEFGNKYDSYAQGKKAINKINHVTDSLYAIANTTNTIAAWDSYIKSVPSSYIKDAEQKKKAIYQSLYDAAKKKNTIAGWNDYKSKVPASEYRDADSQIDKLTWKKESTAWQKAKDGNSISLYEKYLEYHPYGSHAAAAKKRIIDLKVANIGAGSYGTLPPMDKTSWGYGSTSDITVTNDTQYTLTIMYSGSAQSKEMKISPGGTKSISLPNGNYRIAASVNAHNVRSFYGQENLTGGSYSASYYISTSYY